MFKHLLDWMGEHPILTVILIFLIGSFLTAIADSLFRHG